MVIWTYEIEDIVKVGFNTTEAVKIAVDFTKKGVGYLKLLDASSEVIKEILFPIFNCAGKEMSERTFFMLTHEDNETESSIQRDYEEIERNQDKLNTLNRYIFEKAVSPVGANESRRIRELLSEEWAHSYISLVAHKMQQIVSVIDEETRDFRIAKETL